MYKSYLLKFIYLVSTLFLLNGCGVEHKLTRNLADYSIIFEGYRVKGSQIVFFENAFSYNCRTTFIIDTVWKSSIEPVFTQILKRDYDGNGHLIPINDSTLIDEFVERYTLNFETRNYMYPNELNVLKNFNKYNAVFIIGNPEKSNKYLRSTLVFIKYLYNSSDVNYKYIGEALYISVKPEQFKKIEKIINRKSKKGKLK